MRSQNEKKRPARKSKAAAASRQNPKVKASIAQDQADVKRAELKAEIIEALEDKSNSESKRQHDLWNQLQTWRVAHGRGRLPIPRLPDPWATLQAAQHMAKLSPMAITGRVRR